MADRANENTAASDATSRTTARNLLSVRELERQFLASRTRVDRIADAVADFSGSVSFVIFHVLFFALWIAVNLGLFGLPVFDTPPFNLLALVVSLEAIFLSTFVLMKQNRMSRESDQRNHLELQINLLAEREATKILQVLRSICARLDIEDHTTDEEITALSEETDFETLRDEVKTRLIDEIEKAPRP